MHLPYPWLYFTFTGLKLARFTNYSQFHIYKFPLAFQTLRIAQRNFLMHLSRTFTKYKKLYDVEQQQQQQRQLWKWTIFRRYLNFPHLCFPTKKIHTRSWELEIAHLSDEKCEKCFISSPGMQHFCVFEYFLH
jgi:hypothetical protein